MYAHLYIKPLLLLYHFIGNNFGRILNRWANNQYNEYLVFGIFLIGFLVLMASRIMEQRKKTAFFLLLIVLAGTLLRLNGLGYQSLWFDELASLSTASEPTLGHVLSNEKGTDFLPPLYAIILHYVIAWVGDTPSIIRLPSALFGILSIGAIFLLAAKLYSYREGLVSAGFMAVLQFPIYYSQEARPYSMLLFFTLAMLYCWILLLQDAYTGIKTRRVIILLHSIFTLACAYTHYFGLYFAGLLAGAGTLFLLLYKKNAKGLLWSYALALLGYAPWIPSLIHQLTQEGPRYFSVRSAPSWHQILMLPKMFFTNNTVLYIFVLAYSFVFIFTALYRSIRSSLRAIFLSSDTLLIAWLSVPSLIICVQSSLFLSLFQERYFIILLPAAYIILARGIVLASSCGLLDEQAADTRKKYFAIPSYQIIALLFIVLFLNELVAVNRYYTTPLKAQNKEIVATAVHAHATLQDSLLVLCCLHHINFSYYLKQHGITCCNGQNKIYHLLYTPEGIAELRKHAVLNKYTYLVIFHGLEGNVPLHELLQQGLRENFILASKESFLNGNVLIYERHSKRSIEGTAKR